MEIKSKNQLMEVVCEKCSAINTFEFTDFSFELIESEERGMGLEKRYSSDCVKNCIKCKSEIDVTYDIWEYPENVLNNSEATVVGGTIKEDFDIYFDQAE